jgi:hypothetical protein
MRFWPMALQWRGESIFAHLEWQRSTVAAGDSGTIRVDLGDGKSLLRRLVRPVFLIQKRGCDVLELIEGSSWPRTLTGGGAVVVARVSCFILMKNQSGTTPFIGIFSLLLVLGVDSTSTRVLFWSNVDSVEDKLRGGFLSTLVRRARVGLYLTSWEWWSLARPVWASAGELGCEGGPCGGGRKRKKEQAGRGRGPRGFGKLKLFFLFS